MSSRIQFSMPPIISLTGSVADDGEPAPGDEPADLPAGGDRGARAVEEPVAKGQSLQPVRAAQSLQPVRAAHRVLEVADGAEALAKGPGRGRVQRILFGLDRAAGPRVGPAAKALRDEPAGAGRPGSGEQDVGAPGAQPVRNPDRYSLLVVLLITGARLSCVALDGRGSPGSSCQDEVCDAQRQGSVGRSAGTGGAVGT